MTENLYAALAAANATIKNPGKDGRGNYGTYMTLDALLEAVRGPLAAQGLSVVQDVTDDDERVYVTSWLMHASGESIHVGPLSSPRGQNIQHTGGAITYLRRFTLAALLGVHGDTDDDGQAHADTTPARTGTPVGNLTGPAAKNMTGAASPKQVGMIKGLMRDQHVTEPTLNDFTLDRLGFELPTDGLEHLTKGQASAIIEAMIAVKGDDGKPITRTRPTSPDPDDPWADVPLPMEPTR